MSSKFEKYTIPEQYKKIVDFPNVTEMWSRCISEYSDNVAIIDGESYTYSKLDEDAALFRTVLKENGADTGSENDLLPVSYAAKMIPKEYDPAMENGTVFKGDYDEAIAKDITEIVLLLLEDRDPDISSGGGTTLLMHAASVGNVYLVNHLLSMGADTTLTNRLGETAYDIAVKNGQQEVAFLLEKTDQ